MSDRVQYADASRLQRKFEALRREDVVGVENAREEDFFDRKRRVYVEEAIRNKVPDEAESIIARGPKFVPQSVVNDKVVNDVKVSVERFAFGRRWSKTIEESREERKAEERLRQEVRERNLHGQGSEEKNAVDGDVTDAVQEPSKSDGGQEAEVLSEEHPITCLNNDRKLKKLVEGT